MRFVAIPSAIMIPSIVHQKVGGYRTDLRARGYELSIRIAKEYDIETIDIPLTEYRCHPENSMSDQRSRAQMEQDIPHFIREHLQTIPLDALIPNLQSEPHAYALRAMLYLLNDAAHTRATALAKEELEKGLQLSPQDPLLSLWKGVLGVQGDENLRPFPWEEALPGAYQSKVEELSHLYGERKRLTAEKRDPSEPAMVDFRGRFLSFRSALVRDTFRKATGKA